MLVVTHQEFSRDMAAPAIRTWRIAEALGASHDVVLATTSPWSERRSSRFEAVACTRQRLDELEAWCSVVLLQPRALEDLSSLRHTTKVIVVDLFDPFHFESLKLSRIVQEPDGVTQLTASVRLLNDLLARGDFFICASEKQRDLWLGHLSAVGRVNPATYGDDPTLRRLIDVASFGFPERPPVHTRQVLKGVVAGIGEHDDVVLCAGGVPGSGDPLTLVRAIAALRVRRPSVRLCFLGLRHPGRETEEPATEEPAMLAACRKLAVESGLDGTHVFFDEVGMACDDRQSCLLESDVGVSLHLDEVEAAYSFNPQVLDFVWARIPIVATGGDGIADLIADAGLGRLVPAGDVDAVEQALYDALIDRDDDPDVPRYTVERSARFVWSATLEPLVAFCAQPRRAPDEPQWPDSPGLPGSPASVRRRALRVVATAYRSGEVPAVLRGVSRRVKRIWRGISLRHGS